MFHDSFYGIFFVHMVVHSLFLSGCTSFQLTSQSLVFTSRAGRILVYSYQLHFLFPGLFGTVLSFRKSFNLVRVFPHQGFDSAAHYTWVQRSHIFQPISFHNIFPRSFPVRHLSALHFHHFVVDFNFLHFVYILELFSIAFEPLSVLVLFFSYTPDITPKFDTIFRIRDNSISLFFSIQIFVLLFLVDLK